MSYGATAEEQMILDDMANRLGVRKARFQAIQIDSEGAAQSVIPFISEWMNRSVSSGMRAAFYYVCKSKWAYPYLDLLLSWWINEQDHLASNTLTHAIAAVMRPARDSERVWQAFLRRPIRAADDEFLLVVLHKNKNFRSTVESFILNEMLEYCSASDLPALKKLQFDDERLVERFGEGPRRKVSGKINVIGISPVVTTVGSPESEVHLNSFEIDLADLAPSLVVLADQYRLIVPPHELATWIAERIAAIRDYEWLVLGVLDDSGKALRLWIRREDYDVVEIWLTDDIGDRKL